MANLGTTFHLFARELCPLMGELQQSVLMGLRRYNTIQTSLVLPKGAFQWQCDYNKIMKNYNKIQVIRDKKLQ